MDCITGRGVTASVLCVAALLLLLACATAEAAPSIDDGEGIVHRVRRHRHGQRTASLVHGRGEELRIGPATTGSGARKKTDELNALLGAAVIADQRPTVAPLSTTAGRSSFVEEKCRHLQCGSGRVCKLNNRAQPFCDCVPEEACKEGRRKVCGSNGVVYGSHCHLHRVACIEGKRLRAADSWDVCDDAEKKEEEEEDDDDSDYSDDEEGPDSSNEGVDGRAFLLDSVGVSWTDDDAEPLDSKESLSVKKDIGPRPGSVPQILEPLSSASDLALRCDRESFQEFKLRILEYHCNRIGLRQCRDILQDDSRKSFVVNAMFTYYDKNGDDKLNAEELSYGQGVDHIEKIASTCRLTDLLVFRDSLELDGGSAEISKWEFELAYGVDMDPATTIARAATTESATPTGATGSRELPDALPPPPRITPSSIAMNEAMGVQLQCAMDAPGRRIVWERNGINLAEAKIPSLQVLADNSLYISPIDLHHTGNYSCYDRLLPAVVEVHAITVQVYPVVKVRQISRIPLEGEAVELQCRVSGIPQPQTVGWEVNGYRLPGEDAGRYGWANSNTTLRIASVRRSRDTGVYSCVAQTDVGKGQDSVEITSTNDPGTGTESTGSVEKVGKFLVFYEDGYTLLDPQLCVATNSVDRYAPDFSAASPDTESMGILCPPATPCKWGSAASAGGRFVYASQPDEKRLIVVDLEQNSRPVQAIALDGRPVAVFYVKHLDELWVLCESGSSKAVYVIQEASSGTSKRAARMATSSHTVDQLSALFMPPSESNYGYTFPYAFATRGADMGMYRIELSVRRLVQYVNLSQHECQPQKIQYVEIGGLAVVQCAPPAGLGERRSRLLLFDTVTLTVVQGSSAVLGSGVIHSTPGGRQLVVVNGADHIVVYSVADDGTITLAYEEWLSINIGEVRFMPAKSPASYDLAVYSADESIVFFMSMDSRKMQMLEGLATGRKDAAATPRLKEVVTTSGPFGVYLMLPSKGLLMVVNKYWHNIQCQWSSMKSPGSVLWLDR